MSKHIETGQNPSETELHKPPNALSLRFPALVALALIVAFNFGIRWHLRNLPLERDEGEYAYAGQLILQGVPPYQLVYNMKFPGTYFAYALLMAVFGQSTAGIHIGILLVTSLTAILVFLIGRELLGEAGAALAAAIYVCLSALPMAAGLAGHATHFVSLFACAGVYALLLARKKNPLWWWFASGTAFGLAILMKQHAFFFPIFILGWFFWKESRTLTGVRPVRVVLLFGAGCVVPFLITAIGFACLGLWDKFVFWTFEYARQYVSLISPGTAVGQFVIGFGPVFESGVWVWFIGIAGMFFLFRRGNWTTPVELAGVLFLAGMAATVPGFFFRNHYFLMAMPGLALLNAGFVISASQTLSKAGIGRWSFWLSLGLALFLAGDLVWNNSWEWFGWSRAQTSPPAYGISFPASIPIAEYLKKHTSTTDTIAVLGSEPELFFLSGRHSASGYIYMYTLTEPEPLAPQMRKEFISQIESARPRYVVFVNMPSSWFSVVEISSLKASSDMELWWDNYSTNYALAGAVKFYMDKPAEYVWDKELANHPDVETNDDVLIYCQK